MKENDMNWTCNVEAKKETRISGYAKGGGFERFALRWVHNITIKIN
jgi:hypothetical protein